MSSWSFKESPRAQNVVAIQRKSHEKIALIEKKKKETVNEI